MGPKNSAQNDAPGSRLAIPESVVWCLRHYVEAYPDRFHLKEEITNARKILRVLVADPQR